MKKLNNKGFGAIEIVILVVIVGVIGGIGWYVYNAKKQTEATLDNTAKSQSEPQKASPKTEAATEATSTKKYLEIKELGVKIELVDANTDAYYVVKADLPDTAYLSLNSIKSTDDCAADKTSIGAISKYKKTDKDERSGKTYEEVAQTAGKIVGDYAYILYSPQAACTENTAIQTKADTARTNFVKYMSTIQAL